MYLPNRGRRRRVLYSSSPLHNNSCIPLHYLLRRDIYPVRLLRPYIRHGIEQVLDHLAARLVANLLDFDQSLIRLLAHRLLVLLVAA